MNVRGELVPVPPHGRLIDADALIEDLKYDVELDAVALDSMEIVGNERRKIQDDKDFKQNCISWIKNAPTIIPASDAKKKDPNEAVERNCKTCTERDNYEHPE